MAVRIAGPEEEDEQSLGPGDIVAGKYRIERVLGRGGMGVVVSAIHLQLDDRVAIKFLLPGALSNADAIGRFDREARAARKIKSEHVARVIDVGTLEAGTPFMVMEHLDGDDLAKVVKKYGPFSIDEGLTYILQVCEALAEAHALGIVHRDLKPGNLFLTMRADGSHSVKVLDFGISKILSGGSGSENQAALTATDTVLGSPLYMAPEQMSAPKTVNHRADIWGAGATLFMMLTGKPPFDGDSIAQVCGMILLGKPPSLLEHRPDAPPGLEEVLLRCLQRNPDDRYANIAEFAVALAEFAPPLAQLSAERAERVLTASNPQSGPGWQASTGDAMQRISSSGTTGRSISSSGNTGRSISSSGNTGRSISSSGNTARSASSGGGVTARSNGSVTDSSMPKTVATWAQSGETPLVEPGFRPRQRWPLIVGGLMAVLGVGIGVGALSGQRDSAPGATPPPTVVTIVTPPPPPVDSASARATAEPAPSASAATKSTDGAQAGSKSTAKGKPGARPAAPTTTAAAPQAEPPPPPPPPPPKKKGGDLFEERL